MVLVSKQKNTNVCLRGIVGLLTVVTFLFCNYIITSSSDENNSLSSSIQRLENANRDLEKANEELEKKNENLAYDIEELRDANEKLQNDLQTKNQELESLSRKVEQTQQQSAASSSQQVSNIPRQKKWKDWPAVAYEQVGKPLVFKGDSFYNHARELYFQPQSNGQTLFDEFLQVYKNRPDPVNMCGIRINHAMALFLAVKHMQPSLVIESGVNQGVSTYFIRAASNTTKIFAIDPKEKPICDQGERWIDNSTLTVNYTGENFKDILDLDWKGMVEKKEIDPDSTLVFIDDHLHAFKRIASLMKFGVRHVLVEDNYKVGEGATRLDRNSTPKQVFSASRWKKEGDWLFNNIVTYAEFPPLIPPIMAKVSQEPKRKAGGFMVATDENKDVVHPLLRPDLNEDDMKLFQSAAAKLDLDPTLADRNSYMQFMNYNSFCHIEMSPMPPSLLYSLPINSYVGF